MWLSGSSPGRRFLGMGVFGLDQMLHGSVGLGMGGRAAAVDRPLSRSAGLRLVPGLANWRGWGDLVQLQR